MLTPRFCLLLGFAFLSSLLVPASLSAQGETKSEPEDLRLSRTYQRKAIVPLYVNFGNLKDGDIALLSPGEVPVRFDSHPITTQIINSGFSRDDYMEEGELSGVGNALNGVTKFRNNLSKQTGGSVKDTTEVPSVVNEAKRVALYNEMLMREKIGNEIIAKWFDRDEEGVFTVFGTFSERAQYSADYASKIRVNNTIRGLASLTDHADQLVNETYLLVGDISNVQTMAQIYQESESKSRPDRGYKASGTLYVFQLDFGDSIQSIFWNDLWTEENDDSTQISARKQAFEEMNFPFRFVQAIPISGSGTQSKTPPENKLLAAVWTQKSDQELYQECIKGVSGGLASSFFSANKGGGGLGNAFGGSKVAAESSGMDLRLRAPVIGGSPIAARIGNKEGLGQNNTFFIVEDIEKGNGKKFSKKIGAVRVHTVANNSGEGLVSDSTTFYQIAGSEPYVGTMLLEKGGFGYGAVSLGWEMNLKGGMSGPVLRVDFPELRVTTGPYPGMLGLYLSGGLDFLTGARSEIDSSRTFSSEETLLSYRVEKGPNDAVYGRWAIGAMYEQYFGRRFHYNANLGYGQESTTSLEGAIYNVSLRQSLVDVGAKVGMSISPSVQIQVGLHSRIAVASPRIVWSDRGDDDEAAWPLDAKYGEIFPGRGATVCATFGLRVLL